MPLPVPSATGLTKSGWGMGLLFLTSVQTADIPVMSAYLFLVAFLFVAINFIVDLLYVWVDPRIRIIGSGA